MKNETARRSQTTTTTRHGHYAGMDGIKGIALIAIIWYHFSQRTLPGGFVGVDVFLTISGFLLTTGLLREFDRDGRVSLGRFYLRRLARLWPGMMFMVATAASLGLLINADALAGIRGKSLAAATFTSNWVEIASGGSYFATTAPQLLNHLWFVALLAQMTLILPFIVMLIRRIRSAAIQIIVPTALAILSALAMGLLYRPQHDPTRIYFGTDTHCFGILMGVALAFAVRQWQTRPVLDTPVVRGVSLVMPWLATAALTGLVLLAPRVGQDGSAFRGGLFLSSLLTVVLIAGTIGDGSWMQDLCNWRPLAMLGRYSYGIYLWHWPLFLLAQLMLPGLRGRGMWMIIVLALAMTAVMTALSWWIVERPTAAWVDASAVAGSARGNAAGGAARPRTVFSGMREEQVATAGSHGDDSHGDKPVGRRVSDRFRVPVTIAVAILVVVGFGFALASAPERSSVQVMLERNQHALDQQSRKRAVDAKAAAEAKKRAAEESKRRAAAKAEAEKNLTGDQITVIGDSVTVGSSPALESALPGIVIDAKVSRAITAAPDIVTQLRSQNQLRRFVVVSLNTNSASTVDDFDRIAEAAGDGHVLVIVNGYGDRSWIPTANQAASDYVRAHPSDALLVDWDAAIGAHPEMLASDGIHPQGAGQDLYASAIKDAIASWLADQKMSAGK